MKSLIGVPWLHQGRDREVGLDCIGAPRYCLVKQLGRLPEALEREFDAYLRRPDGKYLLKVMREWFDEVELSGPRVPLQPADILVIYDWTNPQHVAVMVSETEVVEAYCGVASGVRKVMKQRLDPRRVIAAVFRFPEGEKLKKWREGK